MLQLKQIDQPSLDTALVVISRGRVSGTYGWGTKRDYAPLEKPPRSPATDRVSLYYQEVIKQHAPELFELSNRPGVSTIQLVGSYNKLDVYITSKDNVWTNAVLEAVQRLCDFPIGDINTSKHYRADLNSGYYRRGFCFKKLTKYIIGEEVDPEPPKFTIVG